MSAEPAATPAFAQFDRGQISGVVKDDTGGVVPGVTVTANTRGPTQSQSETPLTSPGGNRRAMTTGGASTPTMWATRAMIPFSLGA